MIRLKVIGNPAELQTAMQTNRTFEVGQIITGHSDEAMMKLAQAFPHLVVIDTGDKDAPKPKENKMLKKSKVAKYHSK